jgi:hypothetical protein
MAIVLKNDEAVAAAPPIASPATLDPMLPFLVALVLYLVVLVVGNSLLNDADSYWHIAVGEWILANGFPHADPFSFTFAGKPWIAKEWLSQILFVGAWRLAGWPGVVVLAAAAMALAFGLLTRFLRESLAAVPVIVLVAVAFMLVAPHAVARPHVLALPVMVAWVGGLVAAADRGKAPPWWLLLLMLLWANLHGGFTLGLLIAGAVGLDAIVAAKPAERRRVAFVWIRFGVLALVAACVTPYGPESILVTWRILNLGPALSIISEWRPADFGHVAGFEIALLAAGGVALYRGFTLPLVRVVIVLGLLHLAFSAERNAEVFGLLVPLFVAAPLARQFPTLAAEGRRSTPSLAPAVLVALVVPLTVALAWVSDYRPNPRITPEAAVLALKEANSGPVLNDYDFGGYLVRVGVPTFIDGRTELYGGDFTARYYRAVTLADLKDFLALLDEYRIGATLLTPETPAVALLDTLPGWRRLYADDVAVVHVRAPP